MAELKKGTIRKAIRSIEKSYDYHSYNGKYDVLVDLDELVDLIVEITTPTTTESEIRAKAIDEFAEELTHRWIETSNLNDSKEFFEYIYEVAEQLKESE